MFGRGWRSKRKEAAPARSSDGAEATTNEESSLLPGSNDGGADDAEGGRDDDERATIDDVDEALLACSSDPGNYQLWLLVATGLGFMADAMEVTLLGFLYSCLKEYWDLSTYSADFILSCVFAGELVGAIISGPLADKFGRKPITVAGYAIVFIAGVTSAFAPNEIFFIVCRTITGVGIGMFSVPFDLVSECVSTKWRGWALVVYEFWWVIGSFWTIGMGQLMINSRFGWRGLVLACAVPMLLACVALFSVFESPRWLLSQGRVHEAEEVVRRIAEVNGADSSTLVLALKPKPHLFKQADPRELFTPGKKLNTTLPVTVLWLAMGLSFYGTSLLLVRASGATDDDCDFDWPFLWGTYSTEVFGTLALIYTIDRYGRVNSNILFYLLSGVGVVLLGLASAGGMKTLAVASGCFALAAIMAASSATWVVTPELYETEIRCNGHAYSNAMGRIGAFFASYLVDSSLNEGTVGASLGAICAAGALAAWFLEETTSKKLR